MFTQKKSWKTALNWTEKGQKQLSDEKHHGEKRRIAYSNSG
jgi:hypothetical protein